MKKRWLAGLMTHQYKKATSDNENDDGDGDRFTALGLPWWSPIHVGLLTEVDVA